MGSSQYFTDEQFKDEILKCQYCAEKPCREACPAHCSPADFIMAASVGRPSDYRRAALQILKANPLGETCGLVCPDSHCMKACVQKKHGNPLNIPKIQATILKKTREMNSLSITQTSPNTGKKVVILGAGPSGLAAAAYLAQKGHQVLVMEASNQGGGACRLIPKERLPAEALDEDIRFLLSFPNIKVQLNKHIDDPNTLLSEGFNAFLVTTGLWETIPLHISGSEDFTLSYQQYLQHHDQYPSKGLVAVVGGGAVAADCALVAKSNGAHRVEIFVLERLEEMPLEKDELRALVDNSIDISCRTRLLSIRETDAHRGRYDVEAIHVRLKNENIGFQLDNLEDEPESMHERKGFDLVITAIGARRRTMHSIHPSIFFAGDYNHGPSTVVEAVASGKNAASQIHQYLSGKKTETIPNPRKSRLDIDGILHIQTDLSTDFFGRKILSPFLLAAAPPSDGLEQMRKAYQAGWPGGVMKTSFDGVSIHIPSEYMFIMDPTTYGNCDNVSGHPLNKVCREIETLVREYPDRLTMASTGGPVTGDDDKDSRVWQNNTKKLENAGAMGVEFSLSCPQGGDGTKGDIVSQDCELTRKIIGWVLSSGNPKIPKLFKLTPAVTSIKAIIMAIEEELKLHPNAKAGVTLANTFPSLGLRPLKAGKWDEGIVVGLSGKSIMPITCLTLANVSAFSVPISGNGGAMNYLDAAHFLALGAKTVQFCSLVLKCGYSVIDELHLGLSHYLAHKGIGSVEKLIGIALPNPVRSFGELPARKKIPTCNKEKCVNCGNCSRCPYLAIQPDQNGNPATDPARCIGCSLCAQQCFTGALYMRDRIADEILRLRED